MEITFVLNLRAREHRKDSCCINIALDSSMHCGPRHAKDARTMLAFRRAGSGSQGGYFSAFDILGVLYFYHMPVDRRNPRLRVHQRFVLSASECWVTGNPTLAEASYFSADLFLKPQLLGAILLRRSYMRITSGIEMRIGSLGIRVSEAYGMPQGGCIPKPNCESMPWLGMQIA